MNDLVKSNVLSVSLVALLCAAAQGCSASVETSAQDGDGTETVSAALYREALGEGAELVVYRTGEHGAAVGVSMPETAAASFKDRMAQAENEETIEGYYHVMTASERALPASLEGLALDVSTAQKGLPTYAPLPADLKEGSLQGAAGADQEGDIGSTQQALTPDDTWNWTGDASWFQTNYCKTDSIKRLQVECIRNWTSVATVLNGYYHVGTGMAASFNGTATFKVFKYASGAWQEYTNLRTTIQPRYLQTWQFLGDETYLGRQFQTIGNGPTPRVHQAVSVGYPKINSMVIQPSQTKEFGFTAKLTGFKPGVSVSLYYDNPTKGARGMGSGTPSADSTLTITGSRLSCVGMQMFRGAVDANAQKIRAVGADGRVATTTISGLYWACY